MTLAGSATLSTVSFQSLFRTHTFGQSWAAKVHDRSQSLQVDMATTPAEGNEEKPSGLQNPAVFLSSDANSLSPSLDLSIYQDEFKDVSIVQRVTRGGSSPM